MFLIDADGSVRNLRAAFVKGVRAAQILDTTLERDKSTASATDLLDAPAYRAELALQADDITAADALTGYVCVD